MQTRSQTKQLNILNAMQLYSVDIDFDDASNSWKANKVSTGNGCYKYVCKKRSIKNNTCNKKCLPGEEYCSVHLKMCKEGKI